MDPENEAPVEDGAQSESSENAAPQEPAGENWKDKYYGLQGAFKKYREQMAQTEAHLSDLQAEVEELNNALREAEGNLSETEEIKSTLSQKDAELAATQGKLSRIETLMKYPNLINDQYRKLVETSTLEPEELSDVLSGIANAMETQKAEALQNAAAGSTPPAQPPAGSQPSDEAKEAFEKGMEAMREGNYEEYYRRMGVFWQYQDKTGSKLAKPPSLGD